MGPPAFPWFATHADLSRGAIYAAAFVPKLGLGGPVAETIVAITDGVMCPSR